MEFCEALTERCTSATTSITKPAISSIDRTRFAVASAPSLLSLRNSYPDDNYSLDIFFGSVVYNKPTEMSYFLLESKKITCFLKFKYIYYTNLDGIVASSCLVSRVQPICIRHKEYFLFPSPVSILAEYLSDVLRYCRKVFQCFCCVLSVLWQRHARSIRYGSGLSPPMMHDRSRLSLRFPRDCLSVRLSILLNYRSRRRYGLLSLSTFQLLLCYNINWQIKTIDKNIRVNGKTPSGVTTFSISTGGAPLIPSILPRSSTRTRRERVEKKHTHTLRWCYDYSRT